MPDLFLLFTAAFFAGLLDAMVGGGGLIQVPALFSILPNTAAATLFGTNKVAGIFGTGVAAAGYARRVKVQWNAAAPAAMAAFICAFIGAYVVTKVPSDFLRKLLPLILLSVLVYTWRRKDLGQIHAPLHGGFGEQWLAVLVGAGIGFYDGFFGPGTGSFLVFLFVRVFGFDFLGASAASKIVNVACNCAALLWFGYSGHVLWQLGVSMAAFNILGSLVGTRLAVRHGSSLIRRVFLFVVLALILKTAYDGFIR